MIKKRNYSREVFILFFFFIASPIFSSTENPIGYDDGIPVPPVASIDNYLVVVILICILFVGYYYHNLKKNLIENK